jgi:hypothetical protein
MKTLLRKQVVSGAPYFDSVAHSKCVIIVTLLNFNSVVHFVCATELQFLWRICFDLSSLSFVGFLVFSVLFLHSIHFF